MIKNNKCAQSRLKTAKYLEMVILTITVMFFTDDFRSVVK